MKFLKKMSMIIGVTGMVFLLGACAKKEEGANFSINYAAMRGVDEIIYSLSTDGEFMMKPQHEDPKIVKGNSSALLTNEAKDVELSVKVIDEGAVIYETSTTIDLSEGKKIQVNIIDSANGSVTSDIVEK